MLRGVKNVPHSWQRIALILGWCLVVASSAPGEEPAVGVYYFPGWYRPGGAQGKPPYDNASDWSEWRGAIMKAAKPRPLAGFYNDADPRLWRYYVDWMSGHGIDFIAFDWYYNAGQEYLSASMDEGFLRCDRRDEVRFCLHWCNHGGAWWTNRMDQSLPALTAMIDHIGPQYFARTNYLRMGGRPVFMIYDLNELLRFGGREAVRAGLQAMRQRAERWGGLYLVGVYSETSSAFARQMRELGFDAFCAYTYVGQRGPKVRWDAKGYPYREVAQNVSEHIYPFLARQGRQMGLPYWPTVFSGWDDRPRAGLEKATVLTDNTPAEFGRLFRSALRQVNPDSPVVIVEAWNEWGEGANIEPSREHGFGYLEEIARARREIQPSRRELKVSPALLPSVEEIRSWSILNTDELAIAQRNEQKPWPVLPTMWNRQGQNIKVPEAPLPHIIDFAKVPLDQLQLNQLTLVKREPGGLVLKTTGTDASLNLPPVRIPTSQIRRICIEAEAPEAPGDFAFELFWATGLFPDFTPFASVTLPGKTNCHIATDEIMAWPAAGTPLQRLRIDPGMRAGVTVKLKRVVLEGK